MKSFWKYISLTLAPFLLLNCAAPITQPVKVNDALVAIEAQRQRELVLKKKLDLQNRLDSVAFPLLKAAVPFCTNNVWPSVGFSFLNKHSFSPEFHYAAIANYAMNELLQITYVVPNSNAEKAGLLPGDILVSINTVPVPTGVNAQKKLFQILHAHLISGEEATIIVLRKDEKIDFAFLPEDICEIPTICNFNSNELNASTDGKSVLVDKGLMRFVENDQELALVLAHEIAHSIMGHIDAQTQNMVVGSIFDILAAIYGVNTKGAFAKIGAEQYSQEFEFEADAVGIYLMARAGYELDNTVMFWRKFGAENPSAIGRDPSSSHPSSPERFAAIEKHIEIIKNKKKAGLPILPDIKRIEGSIVASETATGTDAPPLKTTMTYTTNAADNWIEKSYQAVQNQEWAEAIRTSSVAISINPGLDTPYVNRAWAYSEKGLLDKAIDDCNKAIEINPNNAAAINNRGMALLKKGEKEKGLDDYKTACMMGLDI